MITTVTTSTISTIISTAAVTATVSIVVVVSLIFFLTIKELANAGGSRTSVRIAGFFSVGTLPLVMAFAAIAIVKIIEFL